MSNFRGFQFHPVFLNDFDTDLRAFVPEVWAQASLMRLEDQVVMPGLINVDYSNELKRAGDVVNISKIYGFEAKRKIDGEAISKQAAHADKIPVALDQHIHTSFIIYDVEETKSLQSLVDTYIDPAVSSIAQAIDEAILARKYSFLAKANLVGKLGTAISRTTSVNVDTKFDTLLIPPGERRCVLTPVSKGDLLLETQFTDVDRSGSSMALRNSTLGRLYSTDYYMSTNNRTINSDAAYLSTVTGTINNVSGEAAGQTVLTVDAITGAIAVGTWCTVAGDNTPQQVTDRTLNSGGNTIEITVTPGLKYDVLNDAVITFVDSGTINYSSNYAAKTHTALTVDNFALAPQRGQLVSFGAGSARYATIGTPTSTSITVDHLLELAANHASVVGIGPAGNYNFCFHKNALALVTRPLVMPPAGLGVRSSTANSGGLSMRVTIGYDKDYQGTVVTMDVLFGVAVLDANLGFVVLG